MSASAVAPIARNPVERLGQVTLDCIGFVGDLTLFALQIVSSLLTGWPGRRWVLPNLYSIGVQSLPVVLITGGFIGMVMAVQSYDQLRTVRMEATLGTVVNMTLVKELGPVLAAIMLAGRVGSAIAAQLGTMKITEQVDALEMLGGNAIRHLVVPRVLSCLLLIPILTIFSDAAGIFGGWLFSTQLLGVDAVHYWRHSEEIVTGFDMAGGVFKSFFFGVAMSVIACHRGLNCQAGAEGVGKAATESFVLSFVTIMGLDFLLGVFLSFAQHIWISWWVRPTML